ncbi:hypothetical protein MHU86_21971 [Fragilaria crotonensis]|nr:hypothetical protein MHU86_21971 [Fragilaria crotonensis]
MVPYLKGLHLTLDFWRGGRDNEGWKIIGREEEGNGEQNALLSSDRKAPRFVSVAPRLTHDIKALMVLTAFQEAPRMEVRATSTAAAYLVGDASGSGFGDCLWVQGEEGMNIAFGSWDNEVSERSSNFREGYNLVLRLENLLMKEQCVEEQSFGCSRITRWRKVLLTKGPVSRSCYTSYVCG